MVLLTSNVIFVTVLVIVLLPVFIHGSQDSQDNPDEFSCRDGFHSGNSSCDFFIDALDNATDGIVINVTTDVTLFVVKQLSNLQFVTIIGHNNPTVNCSTGGGLHFISCYNCTIEGIAWVGCGASGKRGYPAIHFDNSANVTIRNCSFRHSIGQAVVLSEMSGDVSISHSEFVSNTDYKGQGAAITYSESRATENSKIVAINNCKFSHYEATSVAYFDQSSQNFISIKDSLFENNFGNPIYLSNQSLHIHGEVVFKLNTATKGGGIYATDHSNVIIGENANVSFLMNEASVDGGAVYLNNHSSILFDNNSVILFKGNKARNAGVVNLGQNSRIQFDGNCNATFINNKASVNGGTIKAFKSSVIMFKSFATVLFSGNSARFGGCIFSDVASTIIFEGNSKVQFDNNKAKDNGGALLIYDNSTMLFKGNSVVIFTNSQAVYGAAMRSNRKCNITFTENSTVTVTSNSAFTGGAVNSQNQGYVVFEGNSRVNFDNNVATDGGSLYFHTDSNFMIKGSSYVAFYNNTAGGSGGAVYSYGNSDVTIVESPKINFTHNVAKNGGALHGSVCDIKFSGNSNVAFKNNEAVHEGGAIYLSDKTNIVIDQNVSMDLISNGASYGAGVYNNLSESTIAFDSMHFHQYNNTAKIAGSVMYVHVPSSCNRSCLEERIVGSQVANFVTTPPKILVLNKPAIQICNDNASDTDDCNMYYINNIMLGQEILINSCLLNYYDQPAEEIVEFLVSSDNEEFTPSTKYIITSRCSDTKITVTGNRTSSVNYSMTISTLKLQVEERKEISIKLIVGLTSCHSGFYYNEASHKCECFNTEENIVVCSGSSSLIHRGYWFGEVEGKSTVAICPIGYCDFTSCNTGSEFCQLSPERTNQCRSHRSGTACGDCKKGYTLPFYSTECINEDNCTIGHTVIVIVLTVVYWIALVISVFITMYYKVSIGYLYAITYYYSIVDVLLSEYMDISNGLYITINVMYSIVKLTPQFLGQLCLVRGLSGIDQQFIHYVHPLAVSLMLVMIVMLARFSRRLSAFISRGIIRVICFLLLLSYTSVTITSLFLVRHLKYSDVDKLYTYLSPGMEYFQGRHLAYGIISFLCIIFIVIGVPLVLIVEPFLNHKINFARIKPLLDQFQGCYKNKYRWFAGYYMICRIVIIVITIIFSSNYFTSRYLLITICAAVALIHLSVRPYTSKVLNAFDGLLLLLLVLLSILLLAEFVNSTSVVQITIVLLILPLTVYFLLCLFIHKDFLKKVLFHLNLKLAKSQNISATNNITPKNHTTTDNGEYDITIDDRMRMNATICDM